MRLQELLENTYEPNRIDYESSDDLLDKVVGYIEDNCRPWLEAAEGRVVYRGVKHAGLAFTRKVRQDRIPHDSSEEMHDLFNGLISLVGGVANRTNSAFTTAVEEEAMTYGDAYVAIPVGPFNYTWSPSWSDWFTDLVSNDEGTGLLVAMLDYDRKQELANTHIDTYDEVSFKTIINPANYDPEKVQRHIYADRRLKDAIDSGHEIMIACDTMLYIDSDFYRSRVRKYV
jgi:hypothetical protein